jgi:hypothetical protein
MFPRTHANCAGGSCIRVTWARKTRAQRRADARGSSQRPLAGLSVGFLALSLSLLGTRRDVMRWLTWAAAPQLPHGPEHGQHRDRAPDALPGCDGHAAALPHARRERGGEPRAAEHPGALADGDCVFLCAAPAVGARAHWRAARAGKRKRRRKVRLCSPCIGIFYRVAVPTRRWERSLRGYLTKYDCSSGQRSAPLDLIASLTADVCSGHQPYWRN